jgi:serine/threonine protein kinase
MKLAPGGSLAARVQKYGPLGPKSAVDLMIPILEALAEAHENGIVHRDVKPQNILLDDHGEPWLADWGIARLADRDLALTRTGIGMGSIATMAPEQRRDAHEVGPTADVYAAGATLYHLLTRATPVDLFAARADSPRWANLPDDLAAILRRSCAWKPEDRYPTATAMVEALRSIEATLPDRPVPPPPGSDGDTEVAEEAPARGARSWRWIAVGGATLLALGGAVAFVITTWADPRSAPPPPTPTNPEPPRPPEPVSKPLVSPPPVKPSVSPATLPPVPKATPSGPTDIVAGTSPVGGSWRGSLEGAPVRLNIEGPPQALRGTATFKEPDGTSRSLTLRGTLAAGELTFQAQGQGVGSGQWVLHQNGERWAGEVTSVPANESWNLTLSRER